MKVRLVCLVVGLVLAATAFYLLRTFGTASDPVRSPFPIVSVGIPCTNDTDGSESPISASPSITDSEPNSPSAANSPLSEERPLAEAQRSTADEDERVDAFDGLTDRWMEPKSTVTMKDVSEFVRTFRQVPKARQDECIHRALNLVPDENVMLLAGVLMDKEMDRDIVETVFNDILNRDEVVKMPILKEVFKDRKHPCWADVAWILDVTGEIPAASDAN